ncbi:MAG: hypothetical protein IIV45_10850 [Lachnospiraceae bacterium]|nr:hypothetical protein [Lachnospiraceae bacterium]MBQ5675558.1 hypothetical protein [Lachnospiraceae bacterium]
MSLFKIKRKKRSITTYLPVLFSILFLCIFVSFSDSFSESNRNREKEILQAALNRSIVQCYALEGTYPDNLVYLQENYGFTYNEEHFYIDYHYIGGNLRPDVTIIERK